MELLTNTNYHFLIMHFFQARRNAIGGPYLAVHLRRRDFLNGRARSVPTIKSAAEQLSQIMKDRELENLFVATDAPDNGNLAFHLIKI